MGTKTTTRPVRGGRLAKVALALAAIAVVLAGVAAFATTPTGDEMASRYREVTAEVTTITRTDGRTTATVTVDGEAVGVRVPAATATGDQITIWLDNGQVTPTSATDPYRTAGSPWANAVAASLVATLGVLILVAVGVTSAAALASR